MLLFWHKSAVEQEHGDFTCISHDVDLGGYFRGPGSHCISNGRMGGTSRGD